MRHALLQHDSHVDNAASNSRVSSFRDTEKVTHNALKEMVSHFSSVSQRSSFVPVLHRSQIVRSSFAAVTPTTKSCAKHLNHTKLRAWAHLITDALERQGHGRQSRETNDSCSRRCLKSHRRMYVIVRRSPEHSKTIMLQYESFFRMILRAFCTAKRLDGWPNWIRKSNDSSVDHDE